jgi:hypothetical protein
MLATGVLEYAGDAATAPKRVSRVVVIIFIVLRDLPRL